MLNITNLFADYGGKPALEEINLTLDSGELLVVLGPSGAGNDAAEPDRRVCTVSARHDPAGRKTGNGAGRERGVVFQNEGLPPVAKRSGKTLRLVCNWQV